MPVFDRFVITKSSDEGKEDGHADQAIRHFHSALPHDAEQIDRILAPYRARFAKTSGET